MRGAQSSLEVIAHTPSPPLLRTLAQPTLARSSLICSAGPIDCSMVKARTLGREEPFFGGGRLPPPEKWSLGTAH